MIVRKVPSVMSLILGPCTELGLNGAPLPVKVMMRVVIESQGSSAARNTSGMYLSSSKLCGLSQGSVRWNWLYNAVYPMYGKIRTRQLSSGWPPVLRMEDGNRD